MKHEDHVVRGNINSVLKLLTNNMENGLVPLNKEALANLAQNHPEVGRPPQYILFNGLI